MPRVAILRVILIALTASVAPLRAEGSGTTPAPPPAEASAPAPVAGTPGTKANPESQAEEVEVEKIREKYWSRGSELKVQVVQNRAYKKRHKFELGLVGGPLSGDPFLKILVFGGSLGFHISELISVHALAWNASASASSALSYVQGTLGANAPTNKPKLFLGGEARGSALYGKLSLSGSLILYLDGYLALGAGQLSTDSAKDIAIEGGLGQQIHFTHSFSFNLDYRLLRYSELVPGIGNKSNLSGLFTVGLSVVLDPFGADTDSNG